MFSNMFAESWQGEVERMNKVVIAAAVKASMFKEALASCQMEGIGLDLTVADLYLAELGHYKSKKKEQQIKEMNHAQNKSAHTSGGQKKC